MFAVPANTVAVAALPPGAHPALIARAVATDRTQWAHLLRYDPDQRYTALLREDDGQQVWLMTWLPGQKTDLHDHGPTTGAFTVVSGALTEQVVRSTLTGTVEHRHPLRPGQSRAFGPGYVHQVVNLGPDPAVSVHVYRGERTMTGYLLDPVSGLRRR
jgi:predicted metal-dependent enzyme (double-stranded beta helix superfamily)